VVLTQAPGSFLESYLKGSGINPVMNMFLPACLLCVPQRSMGCGDRWTRVKCLGTRLARIWAATRLSDHSGQYLHLLGQQQQVMNLVLEIRSCDVGLGKSSWVGSFLLFTR